MERKNGSIVLLDETGAEKLRWNFRERLADEVDRPEPQRERQRGRHRDARDRA